VISDPDVWRGAQLLIKQHGDEAQLVAAQRADEMLKKGDLDGATSWRLILHAVEELQRMKPKMGERVN
jgi:hypothetical protein